MKTYLIAISIVIAFMAGALIFHTHPRTIVYKQSLGFKVGEKVLVNPYRTGWYKGSVIAKYDSGYIINYCGDLGWNNHYLCETNALRPDQMGKI